MIKEEQIIAFKVGGPKSDGGPVYLILGEDERFHYAKHVNFSLSSCIQLGYKKIYNEEEIKLKEEQIKDLKVGLPNCKLLINLNI